MGRLGRRPVLRESVRKTLMNAEGPLTLTDVTADVTKDLGRRIYPTSVLHALMSLQESKDVQKLLSDGRPAYVIAGRAFKESLSQSLSSLITREVGGDTSKLLDNGLTHRSVPYVVFLTPQQEREAIMKRSLIYHQVDWGSPADGIAGLLINDYLALEPEKKRGIAELIAWSYWCGIRNETERFPGGPGGKRLLLELEELKKFLTGTISRAKSQGRIGDARADEAVHKILEKTEDLVRKDNLQDFLSQAYGSRYDVEKLESIILDEHGNYTMTGELIFDGLVKDLNTKFQIGLELAKVKTLSENLPLHMQAADEVWNSFLGWILVREHEFGSLTEVAGSLRRAISMVKSYSGFADDLVKLMKSRQVGAIYVWGFSEVDSASSIEHKMKLFPAWLEALGKGNLDHRIWLFEKRTFRILREALKAVRSGQKPLPLRIDKEQWTLADVYDHYYKGKEVEFWVSLINAIRDRMGPENEAHFKAAVPKGIYSEFKKGESRFVRNMLRKEEREVRDRLRHGKGNHESP